MTEPLRKAPARPRTGLCAGHRHGRPSAAASAPCVGGPHTIFPEKVSQTGNGAVPVLPRVRQASQSYLRHQRSSS